MGIYAIDEYHKFVQESLLEKLVTSRYCLDYVKQVSDWGSNGCLGHPALTLMCSIIDSIGTYIVGGGNVRSHFNVLKDEDYFAEVLTDKEIQVLWDYYRNPQTHNSVLPPDTNMDMGWEPGKFIKIESDKKVIHLETMYSEVNIAVREFIKVAPDKVFNSKQIQEILKHK